MQSKAATVAEYLEELPADRRAAITKIRAVIRKNMPKGIVEHMSYGMIAYSVPHKIYPAGYQCDPKQPLPFAGLASQKNHYGIYLMSVIQPEVEAWVRERFAEAGRKLDMGKCCLRFRKFEDVPLDLLAEMVARVPLADYITACEDGVKMAKQRKAERARG